MLSNVDMSGGRIHLYSIVTYLDYVFVLLIELIRREREQSTRKQYDRRSPIDIFSQVFQLSFISFTEVTKHEQRKAKYGYVCQIRLIYIYSSNIIVLYISSY